jgi:hypothetical protein
MKTADEILAPLLLLVRVMRDACDCPETLRAMRAEALSGNADEAAMRRFCEAAEALVSPAGFDAIGVSFPDVIIRDRIAGGETSKTRSIRENKDVCYEEELAKLRRINEALLAYGNQACRVSMVNDGSMAAFTQFVEEGCTASGGVFAHTLGTDIGSGWVLSDGSVPDLPLELYHWVVDLGSEKARRYPVSDVRTIRSENTGIAGTLHCTVNQSGAFRMAATRFPTEAPALYEELLSRGFIVEDGASLICAPDQRKAFLRFLMEQADDGEPVCCDIFREIGRFLGAAWRESQFWLSPATAQRPLYGRLVRSQSCFTLLCEGARETAPDAEWLVADETLAVTPLMRALCEQKFDVAQFAQAVGSLYWGANSLLEERI